MCSLEELKRSNEVQHSELRKDIKNIGLVNKVLLSVLGVIFLAILFINVSYLKILARYSEKSYNVRVETINQVNTLTTEFKTFRDDLNLSVKNLSDTITKIKQDNLLFYNKEYVSQKQWTHDVYDREIHKNTIRSKRNELIIKSKIQ